MRTQAPARPAAPALDISRLPDVRLNDLLAVRELTRTLSFVEAARGLGVTQPNLSRTIRSLERSLGATLFKRSTRTVRATEAGHLLADYCDRALAHLEPAVARMRAHTLEGPPQLRLAISTALGSCILDVIAGVFDTMPADTRLLVSERADAEVSDAVEDGTASLGLSYYMPPRTRFTSVRVMRDRLCAIVRTGSPLTADSSAARFAEVLGGARVMSLLPRKALCRIVRALGMAAPQADWPAAIDSMHLLRLHVGAGTAIGLAPQSATASLPDTLTAIPFPDDAPALTLYAITRAQSAPQPHEQTFVEGLLRSARPSSLP